MHSSTQIQNSWAESKKCPVSVLYIHHSSSSHSCRSLRIASAMRGDNAGLIWIDLIFTQISKIMLVIGNEIIHAQLPQLPCELPRSCIYLGFTNDGRLATSLPRMYSQTLQSCSLLDHHVIENKGMGLRFYVRQALNVKAETS